MDATTLTAELIGALNAVPALAGHVYDGYVPDKLPTDNAGYILPYVVVFSGLTTDLPEERSLTGLVDTTVHDWSPQTTCVGPTPSHARACAQIVQHTLTNLRIGNHRMKPDTETFRANTPVIDSQVTPSRFYLPLPWRLTTN